MPTLHLKGTILNQATQVGWPGLQVSLLLKEQPEASPLGQETTNVEGAFDIVLDSEALREKFGNPTQLQVSLRITSQEPAIQHDTPPKLLPEWIQEDNLVIEIEPPVATPFLTLKGNVRDKASGQGIPNLLVKAWDKDISKPDFLGESTTEADGAFSITFERKAFADSPNDQDPDLCFKIYWQAQEVLDTSANPIKNWTEEHGEVELTVDLSPFEEDEEEKKDPKEYTVWGRIVQKDGTGVPNLLVKAFDKGVGVELLLGESGTKETGSYFITYKKEDLCPGKVRADLIVRAYQGEQVLGASPMIINAYRREEVNIALGAEVFRGPSEFTVLQDRLQESLQGSEASELTSRDVSILHQKLQIEEDRIAYYIKSLRHSERLSMPAEIFYGLYRRGVSTSLNILLSQSQKALARALGVAARKNIINPALEQEALVIAKQLKSKVGQLTLEENPQVAGLMNLAGLNEGQQAIFIDFSIHHEEAASLFWDDLRTAELLDEQSITQLQQTTQLAALTLNHLPLVEAIQKNIAIQEVRDLAKFNRQDWLNLMTDYQTGLPAGVPGEDMEGQYEWYAQTLTQVVENAFPTAVFAHRWSALNGGDYFSNFFEYNPDFDISSQRVSDYLAGNETALDGIGNPEDFSLQLKSAQTLYAIAPQYNKAELISPLIQDAVLSTHHIKLMGEPAFLAKFASPETEADYRVIYQNAGQMADATLLAIMDYIDRYGGLPAYVFPDLNQTESEAGIPQWNSLFGSLDYCACEHCHSVLSPAAYLVDLLIYLNGALADDGRTGMEKLFDRRPDVANLDLTCENALTALPYIDLVNEVLENAVIPIQYTANSVNGVTLPESGEVPQTGVDKEALKAQPEHLKAAVYDQLIRDAGTGKSTVYPWNLPFSLWMEETNTYLEHLEVYRHELTTLFRGEEPDAWASAYLNLTPETVRLLTPSVAGPPLLARYWNLTLAELNDILNNGSMEIERLLQLSGLEYEELKQLILCRFIKAEGTLSLNMINCSLADSTLDGLTNGHFDRIHRFERLRRRLGWSIWDLDRALSALETADITKEIIQQLAAIQHLQHQFPRLSMAELVSWWGRPMDTWKYEEDAKTLFENSFLNPAVNDLDEVIDETAGSTIRDIFALNTDFSELVDAAAGSSRNITEESVFSLCLSAVNLTETEYDLLVNEGEELPDESLNLENLSHLFRLSSFIKTNSLEVAEYLSLKALLGQIDGQWPLSSTTSAGNPGAARAYVKMINALDEAKVSAEELDYLLRHKFSATSSLPLDNTEITLLLEEIRTELQAIEANWSLDESADTVSSLENTLTLLLQGSESESAAEEIQRALEIVEGTANNNDLSFLEPYLNDIAFTEAFLVNRDFALEDMDDRYLYVLTDLNAYLTNNSQTLSNAETNREELAENLDTYFGGDQQLVDEALGIIESATDLSIPEADTFIEDHFAAFLSDVEDAKIQLGPVLKERYVYLLTELLFYLRRQGMKSYLTQRLATEMEIAESVMEALLSEYVTAPDPADPTQSLPSLDLFRDEAFVNSETEMTYDHFSSEYQVIEQLYKIALLIRPMEIPVDDLAFLFDQGVDFGFPDLTKLPIKETDADLAFASWYLLWQVYQLQHKRFTGDFSVLSLLELGQNNDTSGIAVALEEQLTWRQSDVDFLLTQSDGLNPDFTTANWLIDLEKAFSSLEKTGGGAEQLRSWTDEDLQSKHALAARNAAKAKYEREAWPDAAQKLRDPLREKQRDALEAYVIHQLGFEDADDLYAHFLIDTQTNACMMTSRLVLAISSIQLFVQRIRMNLEAELGIEFTADEIAEWPWRKNYRVWEANRKVFLWPENWIEPELRDDKSPFFQELEDALLQDDVNDETVERAYLAYLRKLDTVGQLEISASHYDEEQDIYHVVGRTKGIPHLYFYRQWVEGNYWTAWEPLDLDIQGDHLAAYVYNRRLYLMWLLWEEKAKETSDLNNASTPSKYWEIKLAWSEYKDGRWSPAKLSSLPVTTKKEGLLAKEHVFMRVGQNSPTRWSNSTASTTILQKSVPVDPLEPNTKVTIVDTDSLLVVLYHRSLATSEPGPLSEAESYLPAWAFAYFELEDCGSEFVRKNKIDSTGFLFETLELTGNAEFWYQYYQSYSELPFSLDTNPYGQEAVEEILSVSRAYSFHHPAADYGKHVAELAFFYYSDKRTFLVTTYDRIISRSIPGDESSSPTWEIEIGEINPGLLDTLAGQYLPDIEPPDLDNDPKDETDPLPEGYTGNDGRHYFQGILGENTTIIRGDNGLEEVYYTPSATESTMVTRARATPLSQDSLLLESYKDPTAGLLSENGALGWQSVHTDLARGFHFHIFYHPYTCLFIRQLNRHGVEGLLAPNEGESQDASDVFRQQAFVDFFSDAYQPTGAVSTPYPVEDIDFTFEGAYSSYNWEVFFHIPLLIANRLMQNQQFEQAQQWFHYIFDPTRVEGEVPRRFWLFKPFYDYADEAQTDSLYKLLGEDSSDLSAQIEVMEKDPFDPHAIARLRTVAYMKTVVMKYLDNLIAWGDYLFRQDSMESINEATQLYVLAAQILGRSPVQIEAEDPNPHTFNDLFTDDLFGLSNAMVEIESEISVSNSVNSDPNGSGILSTMLYFCIPHNEQLLGYWDTVADRLYKIRNCMNIEGVKRSLALFQPPIDPALLVKATAAGIDISSVLQDLNAPLPYYRFRHMIQKANEFCRDVKALGGALLSALEKKDAEELALIRSANELELLKAVKEIKKRNVEEAEEVLNGLKKSLEMANTRMRFYSQRQYINDQEGLQQKKLKTANLLRQIAQLVNVLGAGLALTPDGELGTAGVASPYTTLKFGGKNLSASHTLVSGGLNIGASILDFEASKAGIEAGYIRRYENWMHQAELAQKEIEQVNYQITAAEIRLEVAKKDLGNQEMQIEQSRQITDFMKRKYTNKDLYSWMVTQISGLYFQAYNLAYDVAKRAERCFRQELAIPDSNYIQFGYYDSLKKGLLSGERLQKDLRRLEAAYLEQNKREYELTKHISLRRLNPLALLELKTKGECELALPEWLFDLDTPGHYLRRIKSVAVSMPTVAGPYTSVNGTLSLLKSSVRKSALLLDGQYERQEEDDRFVDYYGTIQSIVTSSGQNDSGLFETNLQDERYLPFEGAGAESTWKLKLPQEYRQFDYNYISDVILHLRYTAREGGETLAAGANGRLEALLTSETGSILYQFFSVRHDFPMVWRQIETEVSTKITILQEEHFPYLASHYSLTNVALQMYDTLLDNIGYEETIPQKTLKVELPGTKAPEYGGDDPVFDLDQLKDKDDLILIVSYSLG